MGPEAVDVHCGLLGDHPHDGPAPRGATPPGRYVAGVVLGVWIFGLLSLPLIVAAAAVGVLKMAYLVVEWIVARLTRL